MSQYFETGAAVENSFFKLTSLWHFGIVTTTAALKAPAVKNFIETDRTPFDLVISEQFQQEAFNMFSLKYNCPLIVIGTLEAADFMDRSRGSISPWSHVPHFLSYSSDRMSFLQRLENTAISLFDALGRKFYYLPKQTQLAREAFKSLENQLGGKLPSTEDLEKKIALHLINSHPALSYARPRMPGLVDIAGVQIRPTKPLPDDIKKFLDDAKDGAIYVSFGTFLRSSDMSSAKYKAMLDAFRALKQRVLWKWESDNIPDLPSNVMVKKWLPQSDIFAHKNVKLFIGHGGIFGLQEAVYHGLPMVLFPSFGDQHLNGHKMEQRGIAIVQSFNQLSSESLLRAINQIIGNQTYYENVRLLSEIFRSNQNSPLDTAVWWIEYILKFRGAQHLQSPSKNLSWFRYLQLDIVFVIFGALYMIYDLLKQLFNKADAKKTEAKKDQAPPKKKTKSKKKD